ncbi:HNH endonuclease [Arenimonas caeni]|uniref:HNH endonuclease n=2 Tax=Arenimonas caeni TaxID=2058085 RepID=A0A2P6M5H8_9GAMM|nr:HNH endonuclease [Arenimonas caeni]
MSEAFRRYGVEIVNPQWTSSVVSEDPPQVVLSLWHHNFSNDMARYVSSTTQWKGAGKPLFYRHLRQAMSEGLPLRVVVATSIDPEEVRKGNAQRAKDFEPDFSLIGRVVRLEDGSFELAFDRTGVVPGGVAADRASGRVKYWHVAEAVEAIGRPARTKEIAEWLANRYTKEDHSDLGANLSLLTVNDVNRRHYDRSRKVWRTDGDHPRDRLFRLGKRRATTYEVFRPHKQGHWDLQPNEAGVWEAVPLPLSALGQAQAEAEKQAFEHLPPLASDHDARVWTLMAVAQRQGQGAFRAKLLEAYDSCCTISGCNAVAVLEAAHIVPYRGEHTHRVDNGLLLRSDLHTLFDLGLLWINQDHTVGIAASLMGTEYETLEGCALRLPKSEENYPNPVHLAAQRRLAQERHGAS